MLSEEMVLYCGPVARPPPTQRSILGMRGRGPPCLQPLPVIRGCERRAPKCSYVEQRKRGVASGKEERQDISTTDGDARMCEMRAPD